MTKPRVTTTDRLSNIIEVVELGRRSGLLTVERGSNPTIEQGAMYFFQGRTIFAQVEGLRGRDALAVLAGWGQCRFAFEPNAPAPQPNVPPPPSQQAPSVQRAATFPASRPGYAPQSPQRAQPTPQRAPQSPQTPPTNTPSSFNWDSLGSGNLPNPQTPPSFGAPQPGPHTGALTGGPYSPPSTPSTPSSVGGSWMNSWPGSQTSGQLNWPGAGTPSTGPFRASAPVDPAILDRRPRRAPDVRDLIAVVGAYNLSRNHRTMLLLADGEHTVLDVARLSSKPVEDVVALLAELERHGLVYYY
jgi:hypothetical protein